MLLEVEGIVLSETPYGETSKIINLYTKENQNAYNNVITEFATNYKLVNLDKVDITNYLVDSAHPNKDGMEKIAEQIVKDMLK